MNKMNKQVALALGGGGARGLAHIGVIEELLRRGYEITSVSGTSMGALIGGLYATGKLSVFKEWVENVTKAKMFRLLDFTFSSKGVIKGERIIDTLKELIPDTLIEDLHIPYSAIATDICSAKEIVIDKGSLYDAIRASISIPAFFTPVRRDDMLLVDGGVLNPLPINRVTRNKNDLLIAVDVNYLNDFDFTTCPEGEKSSIISRLWKLFSKEDVQIDEIDINHYQLLLQSFDIMTEQLTCQSASLYSPDILVQVPVVSYAILEFYKAREIIEVGERVAREVLDIYEGNLNQRRRKWWKFW